MTSQQEKHLRSLLNTFNLLASDKYRKGAAEHGGNLWQVSAEQLLDFAIEEAIDQAVYLLTLKQKFIENDNNREATKTIV